MSVLHYGPSRLLLGGTKLTFFNTSDVQAHYTQAPYDTIYFTNITIYLVETGGNITAIGFTNGVTSHETVGDVLTEDENTTFQTWRETTW